MQTNITKYNGINSNNQSVFSGNGSNGKSVSKKDELNQNLVGDKGREVVATVGTGDNTVAVVEGKAAGQAELDAVVKAAADAKAGTKVSELKTADGKTIESLTYVNKDNPADVIVKTNLDGIDAKEVQNAAGAKYQLADA